jgi:SAM-dependent methyltransferase
MSFSVPADHYDRWMGRYTRSLAPALADAAGIREGMRVADVGCGPGGLTQVLAERVGADRVAAIDPGETFVTACRERVPGADVRQGGAEALPWEDGAFDAALACLVIAFMRDPDAGVAEMARVTRPGGTVAACMWDMAGGGMRMLSLYWTTVRRLDPSIRGERGMTGTAEGEVAARLSGVGLTDVHDGALVVEADYAGFDDFWEPFTLAIGPAGQHLASLPQDGRERVREAMRAQLPDGPFSLEAKAWFARGTVPG